MGPKTPQTQPQQLTMSTGIQKEIERQRQGTGRKGERKREKGGGSGEKREMSVMDFSQILILCPGPSLAMGWFGEHRKCGASSPVSTGEMKA